MYFVYVWFPPTLIPCISCLLHYLQIPHLKIHWNFHETKNDFFFLSLLNWFSRQKTTTTTTNRWLQIWSEAIQQAFFSLSVGLCPIIMLSSYNKFSHDMYRWVMIFSLSNAHCTSFRVDRKKPHLFTHSTGIHHHTKKCRHPTNSCTDHYLHIDSTYHSNLSFHFISL